MAKDRAYLPETPEEITSDWLGKALSRPVDAVESTVLGEGIGFMGDVLLMQLHPSGHAPDSVVVKLPKKANRVMGEMLGVYEREIMFFDTFGAEINVRVPKVHFSEFDRDKGSENQREILAKIDQLPLFFSRAINFLGAMVAGAKKRRYLLMIEYLEGMRAGDQLAGLDAPACQQVLTDIALMHRQYWNDPRLDEQFWLLPLNIDARLRHGIFLRHVDDFARTAPAGLADKLTWLREHGEGLSQRFVEQAQPTLLPGDLRLDNVVFDGEHCAFIDWQLVRSGPAAYDIAYFLSSALLEEASHEEELQLLEAYVGALDRSDYGMREVQRDYYRGLMTILANLTSVEQVQLGDGRGQAVMAAWFRRLAARLDSVDLHAL